MKPEVKGGAESGEGQEAGKRDQTGDKNAEKGEERQLVLFSVFRSCSLIILISPNHLFYPFILLILNIIIYILLPNSQFCL